MIFKNLILNFYQILLIITIIIYLFYIFLKYYKNSIKIITKIYNYLLNKIETNKKIKKIAIKHPKKILFLIERIKNDNFFQLPFTILLFIILYILFEYIGITDSILDGNIITQIDIRLSDFFYYFKDQRLINFFIFISFLGNTIVITIITIIISIILYQNNKKYLLFGYLSSIILSSIIANLSKIIIQRSRPELAIIQENSYSFPSYHATISIALYGFIFFILYKKYKSKNIIIIGIIFAFLVGLSRLYLNVHYLSDVIAGWYLGALGLFFGITISSAIKHIIKKKVNYNKSIINNKILYIILIIFLILYYPIYYKNIIFLNPIKKTYIKINNIQHYFNKYPNLKFTETITGRKTEAINFIFLAKNKKQIEKLFIMNKWNLADKLGRYSIKNMTKALLENKKYTKAPITPLYYNKKIQTLALQKLTNKKNIKYRHHIRIWQTNFKINNKIIFVGCGIYDNGLKWGITHKIDPNIDKEREYIFGNIEDSPQIKNIKLIQLEKEFSGTNFSGDNFFTDGKVYLIELK